MVKGLNKIFYVLILIASLSSFSFLSASLKEKDYLIAIKGLADKGKKEELNNRSKKFFKLFPNSKYIPDVRLILAENEKDTEKSLYQYRVLVDKYRFYPTRDFAQYRICQILYLMSKWKELKHECSKGIRLFPKSRYFSSFKFLLIKAYIYLGMFDEARGVCLKMMQEDHKYENLAESLMQMSYINKKTFGHSQSYLYSLVELAEGFSESNKAQTTIYLLGKYYEARADYDPAYSAYTDLIIKFPKSPEAKFASRRFDYIKRFNPSKTNYIPDKKSLERSDKIDIQPETEIAEESYDSEIYSISLGNIYSLKHAKEIKELIQNDFAPVMIVRARNGFIIYAGRLITRELAISVKTRLALEFGLNGRVVRIIKDANRQYLYGE